MSLRKRCVKTGRHAFVVALGLGLSLGTVGCQKGATPTTESPRPVATSLPAQSASPTPSIAQQAPTPVDYQAEALRGLASNQILFREQCARMKVEAEGQPLVRSGEIAVAEVDADWDPSSEGLPSFQLKPLKSGDKLVPDTICFSYTAKSSQGIYDAVPQHMPNFPGQDHPKVKVLTRDVLAFLVDRESGQYLGSRIFRGEVPKNAPQGQKRVLGKKPSLKPLGTIPLVPISDSKQFLIQLYAALESADQSKIAELLKQTDLSPEKLQRAWERYQLLTEDDKLSPSSTPGQTATLPIVSLESIAPGEQGLEAQYSVSTDQGAQAGLLFAFRGSRLTSVSLGASDEELESISQAVVEGEESLASLLESADQFLEDDELKLAETVLEKASSMSAGELTAEDREALAQLQKRLGQAKSRLSAPEVERLQLEALAFVKTGNFKKALTRLKEAEKLDPDSVEVLFLTLRAYDGLQDLKNVKIYSQRILKKHPNSKYAERAQKFAQSVKDKEERLKLGGDITARYVVDKSEVKNLLVYTNLYPTPNQHLDKELAEDIRRRRFPGHQYRNVPDLRKGTKVKVLKTATYIPEKKPRRDYQDFNEVEAAYVKVLSGEEEGRQGWVQLVLVEYDDIGIASEPLALPLINKADASRR
jgi:tetratricopeptide (TPR) repeat protein